MATAVDEVQKCMNLMEALEDTSHDVKNYRTHCQQICATIRALGPLLLTTQNKFPNLLRDEDGARELFHKLNGIIEEAVLVMRSTSNLTTLDKLVNQGEAKKRLQSILGSVRMVSREMECFLLFQNQKNSQKSAGNESRKSLPDLIGFDIELPAQPIGDDPLPPSHHADLITFGPDSESSNAPI